MRRVFTLALAVLMLASPLTTQTQSPPQSSPPSSPPSPPDDAAAKNAQKARAALDAMVQALGGPAWLNLKNSVTQGDIAAFYLGKPSGGTTLFWDYHEWPDHDRYEYTKHRDVVGFFIGREGWEVTYRGKKPLPKDQVDDFLRRRDHSIETVIKTWLPDPKTILIFEGQRLAERHLADQVTLISAQNEAVTIQMDTQTHLPLRRSFEWRDPVYKDKNLDVEEYADYHTVDGLPTAYNISRFKNDDMVSQRYLIKVAYNQSLASDFWDVDAAAHRIKKK
jgi:hypothetical protein